jgi:hypothetical protein
VSREPFSFSGPLNHRAIPPQEQKRDNNGVQSVPRGIVHQARIIKGIRKAERELAPDVIRIMYHIAEDWMGYQSLFFRILLSDQASAPSRLRQNTQRIMAKVLDDIKADETGLRTYFNFRSQSEQATLREPLWET